MISAHWRTGSASAERVGQGEVGVSPAGYMVAARLGTKGSPLVLTAWKGLENTTLTLQGVGFGKEGCLGSEQVYGNR